MKEKPEEKESSRKKQLDARAIVILLDGKIVFLIVPYISMPRASVNNLKKTLGPILARRWTKLLEETPGIRRAELERIVESQMGKKDPRFSLIFPGETSMLEINKKPA